MKAKIISLALILLGFGLSQTFALSIYVSTKGNDNDTGTKDKPFATLQAAIRYVRTLRNSQEIKEPIEILIQEGVYPLTAPVVLTAEDSGTEDSPLLIKGIGATMPILSGALRLPEFKRVTDNLWKTTVPGAAAFGGTVQQLFVNGHRATRARTPNAGQFFSTKKVSEILIDTNKQKGASLAIQKIKLTAEQLNVLEQATVNNEQPIVTIHHAWDRTRKYMMGLSAADTALYISTRPSPPWNKLDNTSQFYLEQAKAFLDVPGEWFLDDRDTLFYIPREGEQLSKTTALVPVIDQLVIFDGTAQHPVQHIHFTNVSFQHTRYLMPMTGNDPAQAAAPTDAAIMLDFTKNVAFDHCEIAHTSGNAIWFRTACENGKIVHSYLHDLGIGGVKIGAIKVPARGELVTNHITIDNNIIRSGGYGFPTGVGVLIFQASDNTVSHNEIADFRYSGISVGWIWGYAYSPTKRNRIVFNHIHHLGWGELSDMGGVYTLGASEGTVVSNNVIHDIYSYGYGGWGLYTDEGSTGITMENNLVYNCKSSAFHQHYGKDNLIRNNIFYNQIKAQLEATRIENHHSFTFTHNIVYYDRGVLIGKPAWAKIRIAADSNIYYDARRKSALFGSLTLKEWQQTTGKDLHSIIMDPEFVDVKQYDFNFKTKKAIQRIQFKPFNYSQAGVYGSATWKKLAQFDPVLAHQFDLMLHQRLNEGEPVTNY